MLDEKGFKRKRFADLFDEMEAKARESFGEDINTSARTPLGIIPRLFAWFLSSLWSKTEDIYNSSYVNTAQGVNLDRIAPYVGISRISEQSAPGEIEITGTANKTIAKGFVVGTINNILYTTLVDAPLASNGKGIVGIAANLPGVKGNVAAGTITQIINPNPDVTSITNLIPTTGGRERETDIEFRERFKLSVSGGGAATLDSIRGALLRVSGVRAAAVVENTQNVPDANGRPPKSFQSYLLGGNDDEIAKTIFATKAAGVESYGDITRPVLDLAGESHPVKFSRAQEVPIKATVSVKKNERYPADGDAQIRSQIIRYIGGTDADGIVYVGINMGMEVVYTRLIGEVYKIDGVYEVTLQVGTGTVMGTQNVAISLNQVAQTTFTDIVVTSHV